MQAGRPQLFALAGLALAACSGAELAGTGEHLPEPSAESSATTPSVAPASASAAPEPIATASAVATDDRLVATVDIGGGPDMPTEAFGSLWILTVDGPLTGDGVPPSVQRIDPATNEIIATVEIPGRLCQGIGASAEAMWACGPDGLVRIDPATNAVVAEVPFDAPLAVSRIAAGAGSVWAFATSTIGPDTIVRVDPATNAVTASIPLGHVAGTMAFGFDALWVTSPTGDVVLRVDPATNAVESWATGVEGAGQIAIGSDALWVTLYGEHGAQAPEDAPTIVRIDPASGEVTAEIDAGTGLEDSSGIFAAADAMWVRGTDPFLVRIDPATAEIVERIDGDHGTGDVTVAFGSVWATSEHGSVMRFATEP
jgi:DNA-binding beta-propeller fold protein YncE